MQRAVFSLRTLLLRPLHWRSGSLHAPTRMSTALPTAVVDHDTQLVAGEWLPALDALGADEREAMYKLMQAGQGTGAQKCVGCSGAGIGLARRTRVGT